MHMQWHKEGEMEDKEVMMHPLDGDVWKALDNFALKFAKDAREVHIGLGIDGFTPFGQTAASYSR